MVETAVIVGVPVVAGIVWLIRLEGRLNTHEGQCAERQKRLDERHKTIQDHLTSMDGKLDRLLEGR